MTNRKQKVLGFPPGIRGDRTVRRNLTAIEKLFGHQVEIMSLYYICRPNAFHARLLTPDNVGGSVSAPPPSQLRTSTVCVQRTWKPMNLWHTFVTWLRQLVKDPPDQGALRKDVRGRGKK